MSRYITVGESYAGQVLRMMTDVQGNPVVVQAGPTVQANEFDHVVTTLADLGTPVGGYYQLTTGSWAFAASLNLGVNGLQIPAGNTVYIASIGWEHVQTSSATNGLLVSGLLLADNLRVTTTGTNGLQVNASAYCEFNSCEFIGATNGLLLNGAVGTAVLNHCVLTGGAAGQAIVIAANAATRCWLNGGWLTGANGVLVDGNYGWVSLSQVRIDATADGISYSGGGGTSVRVLNCEIDALNGISWAAANIPTNGLLVVGNDLSVGAAPFVGHTPATARCNYKANTVPGGLLSETPIVP